MKHLSHLSLLATLTLPASALQIQGYTATNNDRFLNFFSAPEINPNSFFDGAKYTGVGWWNWTNSGGQLINAQIAAVSPRHLLGAFHSKPIAGVAVRFIDSSGILVERVVSSVTIVPNDTGGNSDLCVVELNSPLPDTVSTYPWLNLTGGDNAYNGQDITVFGQTPDGAPRVGEATITGTDDEDGISTGNAEFTWTHSSALPATNDCYFEQGDSGGPSFASVSGQPALVCIHYSLATSTALGVTTRIMFDTSVPHYATRVNTLMEPTGYRLKPVNFTATTLLLPTSASVPTDLRRSNAGEVSFSLENSGGALTGNINATVTFPSGSEPDSISAPGAVTEYLGSAVWNIRKATLDSAETIEVTATWAALPNLPTLTFDVELDSDTAPPVTSNPTFPLNPSFAEWATGLAITGEEDDADNDGLANLLEYAFGTPGDSSEMLVGADQSVLPDLSEAEGSVSISFAERTDSVLRGLSYIVETSTTLDDLSWTEMLPVDAVSETTPFSPEIPGFSSRTITWPADGPRRFTRLRVTLDE